MVFDHLGWAVSIPSGRATVSLHIEGFPLTFTGTGYHDQNFVDVDNEYFADFISEWFFGQGQVGPYVFSYLKTTPVNSNTTVTTGYLARDGVILQNQCSVAPASASIAQAKDTNKLTPIGVRHSEVSGVDVPTGYVVDYVLRNGEKFSFNITEVGTVMDLNFYHRSVGTVVGGKVGQRAAATDGMAFFEWLNPGLNVYSP